MPQFVRVKMLYSHIKTRGYFRRADWDNEFPGGSTATFKRDLQVLADYYRLSVKYDRTQKVYRFDPTQQIGSPEELPGYWFNTNEVLALLTAYQILESVHFKFDAEHILEVKKMLSRILANQAEDAEALKKRVVLARLGRRMSSATSLKDILQALVSRCRLKIRYHSRHDDDKTTRVISPQRLMYYRDNWYLDSWCHLQNDLRSFAVERILEHEFTNETCLNVEDEVLQEKLNSGYGIYAGTATQTVHLKFSAMMARWVSEQLWHDRQKGWFCGEGFYHLQFPYSDDRELVGDILRFGGEVRVVGPEGLKQKVIEEARRVVGQN